MVTTKDHHMGDDAALRRSPGGNMTKDAAEVAREFMARIVALDWGQDGEAEQTLTQVILSEREAARAEEREARWQPIETAPKDGTAVLLLGDGGQVQIGHYHDADLNDYSDKWRCGYREVWARPNTPAHRNRMEHTVGWCTNPTHWIPLP